MEHLERSGRLCRERAGLEGSAATPLQAGQANNMLGALAPAIDLACGRGRHPKGRDRGFAGSVHEHPADGICRPGAHLKHLWILKTHRGSAAKTLGLYGVAVFIRGKLARLLRWRERRSVSFKGRRARHSFRKCA